MRFAMQDENKGFESLVVFERDGQRHVLGLCESEWAWGRGSATKNETRGRGVTWDEASPGRQRAHLCESEWAQGKGFEFGEGRGGCRLA